MSLLVLSAFVILCAGLLVFFLLDSQRRLEHLFRDEISKNRQEMTGATLQNRQEISHSLKLFNDMLVSRVDKMSEGVGEKLGESFLQMNERLESVHQGLGEMKSLASGVGDLTKILSNVKTLGTLGEIQLGRLLEQILTPEQYDQNVATKQGGSERVEYAVKLPGRNDEGFVWLPVDAKFPVEYYHQLAVACDNDDPLAIEEARKELINRIKEEAKDIQEKYVDPPNTTDFAFMFLPFEGLYAEILRVPGFFEVLQRQYRVVLAGPTTLSAMLNALQMGFKTLVIEKRSSEVWELLGAVKTEFSRFGTILESTRRKLEQATSHIELASKKSRTIEKKLKGVQRLSPPKARKLLNDTVEEDGEASPEQSLESTAIPEQLNS